jgi:hypothetical protein
MARHLLDFANWNLAVMTYLGFFAFSHDAFKTSYGFCQVQSFGRPSSPVSGKLIGIEQQS